MDIQDFYDYKFQINQDDARNEVNYIAHFKTWLNMKEQIALKL